METTRTRRLGSLWYFFFGGADVVALAASPVENERDDDLCSSHEDTVTWR